MWRRPPSHHYHTYTRQLDLAQVLVHSGEASVGIHRVLPQLERLRKTRGEAHHLIPDGAHRQPMVWGLHPSLGCPRAFQY